VSSNTKLEFGYIHRCDLRVMIRSCFCFQLLVMTCACELKDILPENNPTARFFKQSFTRLDEGDVRSLAIVMKDAYARFCIALHGCEKAEAELRSTYQLRFNELEINTNKMRKLGFLFQRLFAAELHAPT
jgi:hypothetical protein